VVRLATELVESDGLPLLPDPHFDLIPKISKLSRMGRMNRTVSGFSHLGTATCLAALALAFAGPASADDLNTTTCSSQQVMSSIQKNDPMIWGRINGDPAMEQELRTGLDVVLAAPAGQRQQEINKLEQTLGEQKWSAFSDDIMNSSTGPIGRAINDCHAA